MTEEKAPKKRGRPPGSKNKAAAKADIGHNADPNAEFKRARLVRAVRAIEEIDDQIAELKAERKVVIDEAAENGITPRMLKFAVKIKAKDQAAALAEAREQRLVAQWLNLPYGQQMNFLDDLDRTPIGDKAFEDGKLAGLEGRDAKSSYAGEAEQRWLEGWHAGQQVIRDAFMTRNAAPVTPAEAPVAANDPFDDVHAAAE